jgi:endonuclease YncB( thermonuclease family)
MGFFYEVTHSVSQTVYQVKEGSIYDGDTLRVLDSDKNELKIRFACIDAPEKDQQFGIESRDFLRELIAENNNQVELNIITKDKYDRSVAVVYSGGKAVQVSQVENGYVYPYEQYKDDCPIWDDIKKAEAIAIKKRVNVYKENLEKPWEYRRRK